jgi:hypothetical protein
LRKTISWDHRTRGLGPFRKMIGNPGRKSHVVYGPLRPGPPTSWSLPSPSQPLILTLPHTLPSTHHLRTQMRLIYTFTCANTPLSLATNSSVSGSVFSNCVQVSILTPNKTNPLYVSCSGRVALTYTHSPPSLPAFPGICLESLFVPSLQSSQFKPHTSSL